MIDVDRLKAEHDEITQMATALRTILNEPVAPQLGELFELRAKLTDSLIKHLKTEDWILYPVLLQSHDLKVATTASELQAQGGSFSADYAQHCHRWTAETIKEDWPAYQSASLFLLDRLENRIDREETELYPLVGDRIGPDTVVKAAVTQFMPRRAQRR